MGRYYANPANPALPFYGEHVSRIVSANGTWAAGAVLADILLDKDLLITNLSLQAHMTLTAMSATEYPDAPKRVLQNLAIVGDGYNFLSLAGGATQQMGVLLALLNKFDAQSASLGATTVFAATALDQFYNFHPGHNARDRFDLSAVIPARALSNLAAKIVCPVAAATDAGAGVITAGTYTFEIDGVQNVPINQNMMIPQGYVQAFPHTAITGLYGQSFDVPTGFYVRRAVLLTTDNTAISALRSDAQVTSLQFRIVKDSKPIIQKSFIGLRQANAQAYGVVGDEQPIALGAVGVAPGYGGYPTMPVGFAIVDFRKYFDPIRGLNMRYPGVQQGDAKLDLTIGVATGTTYIYWDLWAPPQPQWIGK